MTVSPTSDFLANGWFFESGIGEDRAIFRHQGKIVEAHIERAGGVKAGMITRGQLTAKNARGGGIMMLDNDIQASIACLPGEVTQGQSFNVEITREAVCERNRTKMPMAKFSEDAPRAAPSLLDRCKQMSDNSGAPITTCIPGGRDYFAAAGWAELLEEARIGLVPFAGGNLDIAITPAMTTIDVDGDMEALPLSIAAAQEVAFAIRRFGLSGSIAIDFPDVGSKKARVQILEAFDTAMTVDCERSAVNGFGLLHIVTRRVRPSLIETMQRRRTLGHALELIRQAQWGPSSGPVTLTAHPAILSHYKTHGEWIRELEKSKGGGVTLQANTKLAIHAGYVAR